MAYRVARRPGGGRGGGPRAGPARETLTAHDPPEGVEGVAVVGPPAVRGEWPGRVPAGGYPPGGGRARAISPLSVSHCRTAAEPVVR